MKARARPGRAAAMAAAVLIAVAALAVTLLVPGGPEDPLVAPLIGPGDGERDFDVAGFAPLSYDTEDEDELLERGRRGYEHVLYAKSPGGVEATAERVRGLEELMSAAAERHGVSAETLGALVFLESAGLPEAMAGGDPEGATGLGQILPGTAVDLLGMSVDLQRSRSLTRRIDRAERRARRSGSRAGQRLFLRRAARLRRARRRADDRFDPAKSLDGAARYLALAEDRFGREDLAVASYHMGIGNLESVIEAYGESRTEDVSYVRLFFDSSPTHHRLAFARLASFGDDSRSYLFRIEAAREIRRLHAEDVEELRRLAALHGAKGSAEEVLRPEDENPPYENGDALQDAYDDGELVALPVGAQRLGYRVDRRMGELARRLDEPRELYRGLRPEALATLLYITKEVRRISGDPAALNVTSTVRDLGYQRELLPRNDQATDGYSLHTTGFAIDIQRDYHSRDQALALEHVLQRLQALGVLDWVYEPSAIHLTVGPDGERFLPLYEALVGAE